MVSRILSAIVAIIYLAVAFVYDGPVGIVKCVMFITLPLIVIWFPDEMGAYTGGIGAQYIDTESPGCLVAFGGWAVLLLPLWAPLVAALLRRYLM
jgi:hypothetical protein